MKLPLVESDYPLKFNVSEIGHIARRVIGYGGWARAGAVFNNSFYIETPTCWVCVVGTSACMGPLAIRCNPAPQMDWRSSGVRVGTAAYLGETAFYLHPLFHFSFADASTWTPPATPRWTPGSLRQGLEYVGCWMQQNHHAADGLGCIISPNSKEMCRVAKRAIEPVRHLRCWLSNVIVKHGNSAPPAVIAGLIGLGPGLTPSGDDFLGGVIIALRLGGRHTVAQQLYNSVSVEQANAGNSISASHLAAAATGSCNASIHTALNAIMAGDIKALPALLENINQIGHTSGWDALAGAVTVLSSWSER